MISIWFNPELNQYQYGSQALLEKLKKQSHSPDGFTTLYSFNKTSELMVEKVFQSLLIATR